MTEEVKEEKAPEEETPEKEPEKEEEAGQEGFVEIDEKKIKEDPDKPGEPLKDTAGNYVPFEEKMEIEGDKTVRTPRLMESWKHDIAEKNWGKEREGFAKTISTLETALEAAKASPDRAKLIKDFAEKSGMDPENVENFLKLAGMPLAGIKKELEDLKTVFQKSDRDNKWAREDRAFEEDFEKVLIPILNTDNIPQENRSRLKKLLHTLAFTAEYANTPLPVIYRGVEDFRQFSGKGVKKSAEASKGGIRGGKEGEIDWMSLEPDDFDKKIKEMAKEEPGMEIRRDGRAVSD